MKKALLALILSAACACGLAAQELTWTDVLSQAKQVNPTLKKAEANLRQAQLNYEAAYTNFLPQLSANASGSESNSDSLGYSTQYSYGLQGSLSLFNGFSDVAGVKGQAANLKIQEATYNRTLSDTVYNLKTSFINLLWAQEMVTLLEDILQKRTQNYDLVKLQYNSGTQDKGSLMRVEADKVSAQYDLDKANRYLQLSALQLLRTIGRDDFIEITATGTFDYDSGLLAANLSGLSVKTPEYINAYYSLVKSKSDLQSAESGLYPSLDLNGSTSKTGAQWAPNSNSWSLGLSLNYPFFPGGKNIYNVKIAKSGIESAEENLLETKQQLEVSVNTSFNGFVDAVANLGVSQKALSASQEQSDIITTQYINGLQSYFNWYSVENDYINALKSVLNARQNAVLQEANFNKVIGVGE